MKARTTACPGCGEGYEAHEWGAVLTTKVVYMSESFQQSDLIVVLLAFNMLQYMLS